MPSESADARFNRLAALRKELAFLEKRLPELQDRPELTVLFAEFKKRIDGIRQEIRALEGDLPSGKPRG